MLLSPFSGNARLAGLEAVSASSAVPLDSQLNHHQDLNLRGYDYNTLLSVFCECS